MRHQVRRQQAALATAGGFITGQRMQQCAGVEDGDDAVAAVGAAALHDFDATVMALTGVDDFDPREAHAASFELNYVALGGILVNVILNLVLIPRFMALGSAVASLVTQLITGLLQVYICYRVFNFRVNKKLLTALVLFVAGLFFVNYFTLHLTNRWMLNFLIMLIFSGLLAFVTGMVNPRSVLRFIKYR